MEDFTGKVQSVGLYPIGTELTQDHAAGATVLHIDDISDFDEDGGVLQYQSLIPEDVDADPLVYPMVEVVYNTVDEDEETILLAEGLPEALPDDTDIYPVPADTELIALVTNEEAEGPVRVRADAVADRLKPGVRSVSNMETMVYYEDEDGEYTARSIFSSNPVISVQVSRPDGSVADLDEIMQELDADLLELNTVTLPALQSDLANANDQLNDLYTVQLPGLSADITDLNTDLAGLQVDLDTLDGKFPVGTTDIQDGAISTPKVTVNTLNGDRILTNSLLAGKIVAGSISTNEMTANTINGDRITVNTLNAAKIVAGSITTDRFTANTIHGDVLVFNTLNGDRIVANTLSAGAIIASTFSGYIITGSILQTDSAGNRMVMKEDTSGGVILSYTGNVTESSPGIINPYVTNLGFGNIGGLKISAPLLGGGSVASIDLMSSNGVSTPGFINMSGRATITQGLYVQGFTNTGSGYTLEVSSGKIYAPVGIITGPIQASSMDLSGAIDMNGSNLNEVGALNNGGNDITMAAHIKPQHISVTAPRNDLTGIPNIRYVNGSSGGEIGYTSHVNSSMRYKRDVHPLAEVLTRQQVLGPKPKRHKMKKAPGDRPVDHEFWSLIAEDMHDSGLHGFLEYDKKNRPDVVDWAKFAAVGHQLVLIEHEEMLEDHDSRLTRIEKALGLVPQ